MLSKSTFDCCGERKEGSEWIVAGSSGGGRVLLTFQMKMENVSMRTHEVISETINL